MFTQWIHRFTHIYHRVCGSKTSEGNVVLYAELDSPANSSPISSAATIANEHSHDPTVVDSGGLTPMAHPSHRERLLSMRLEHTGLCSPRRCERFRSLGIATAGDLALANAGELAQHFGAPRKAIAVIKRYRRAIRLASAVPGMMPRDAILLVSIHRRSVRGIALESPAALRRDLERFAESTKGRLQLRGRRIPSTRRIKRWITTCQQAVQTRPLTSSRNSLPNAVSCILAAEI